VVSPKLSLEKERLNFVSPFDTKDLKKKITNINDLFMIFMGFVEALEEDYMISTYSASTSAKYISSI